MTVENETDRFYTSLCSLLARSGQGIRGLPHERIWLQEAQRQFCPGLH